MSRAKDFLDVISEGVATPDMHKLKVARESMEMGCSAIRLNDLISHNEAASVIEELTGKFVEKNAYCVCAAFAKTEEADSHNNKLKDAAIPDNEKEFGADDEDEEDDSNESRTSKILKATTTIKSEAGESTPMGDKLAGEIEGDLNGMGVKASAKVVSSYKGGIVIVDVESQDDANKVKNYLADRGDGMTDIDIHNDSEGGKPFTVRADVPDPKSDESANDDSAIDALLSASAQLISAANAITEPVQVVKLDTVTQEQIVLMPVPSTSEALDWVVQVNCEDGYSWQTSINGPESAIRDYFAVGSSINVGGAGGADNMKVIKSVDIISSPDGDNTPESFQEEISDEDIELFASQDEVTGDE